eukprot:m.68011 g.68011  ORF g.68011 m.68011 type:complete len:133 (-) comp13663_c0_seq1:261-659(-)
MKRIVQIAQRTVLAFQVASVAGLRRPSSSTTRWIWQPLDVPMQFALQMGSSAEKCHRSNPAVEIHFALAMKMLSAIWIVHTTLHYQYLGGGPVQYKLFAHSSISNFFFYSIPFCLFFSLEEKVLSAASLLVC